MRVLSLIELDHVAGGAPVTGQTPNLGAAGSASGIGQTFSVFNNGNCIMFSASGPGASVSVSSAGQTASLTITNNATVTGIACVGELPILQIDHGPVNPPGTVTTNNDGPVSSGGPGKNPDQGATAPGNGSDGSGGDRGDRGDDGLDAVDGFGDFDTESDLYY